MYWHDLKLALRSLAQHPLLSGLIAATIAVGIAATMIAVTLYHARAGHPIPWKSDTLYAVTLDTRPRAPQEAGLHPEYPPWQLTYRDARALYASKIPVHAVMMYRSSQVVTAPGPRGRAFRVSERVTTADFFTMFDVPFLYGTGWSRVEDEGPAAVVVITKYLNQKLFGGADSVGREITLGGRAFRIAGVVAGWTPHPRYYDLNGGSEFTVPEDVFLPFGWWQVSQLLPNGSVTCEGQGAKIEGFDSFRTQDCVWLQYWVELRGRTDRDRFQSWVDGYTSEGRAHGRFPRPNNNRIVDVATWLAMNDVIGDDSRLQLVLGFVFLGVCVLNTLGLLLAKLFSSAPVTGLRRALGASRTDIIRQQIIEVMVVGVLGGAAGVALTLGGLAGLKGLLFPVRQSDNAERVALAQSLVHMDVSVLCAAVAISVLAGAVAGLYCASYVSRIAPATFVKS